MFDLYTIRRMNSAGSYKKADIVRLWAVPASAVHKVGNNTYSVVEPKGGTVRFIYHRTEIVTIWADGTVILHTGGWKYRFNEGMMIRKNGRVTTISGDRLAGVFTSCAAMAKRRRHLADLREKREARRAERLAAVEATKGIWSGLPQEEEA